MGSATPDRPLRLCWREEPFPSLSFLIPATPAVHTGDLCKARREKLELYICNCAGSLSCTGANIWLYRLLSNLNTPKVMCRHVSSPLIHGDAFLFNLP